MPIVSISRGHLAAVALLLILLLLPLIATWQTEAPWLWPVLTLVLAITIILLTGHVRRKAIRIAARLLIINAISLLNAAFFLSYVMQDQGFNDAFFYHVRPDVIHAGLGEYLPLAALTIGLWISANILTLRVGAASSAQVATGRFKLGTAALAAGSALLFPPLLSLVAHAFPDVLPTLPDALQTRVAPTRIAMPNTKSIIADLAATPRVASRPDEKPPHVVVLYLEGVEQRYFDQDLFPDLLPELSALRARSLDFPKLVQAEGTGWTIAGMTASQCGYPLMSSFHGGANDLGILPTFMPDAVCFGDLLKEAGYALTYMGGADHRFAGKGNFYRSHGFENVYGIDDLQERLSDPGYRHYWGLFDDTLFDLAYEEFLAMAADGRPAGLVLLTLDTHPPKGHPSASCGPYTGIDNDILHAVHCTDQLASDFVRRIRSSPHSDDTYIVIASDHLAMRNTATGILNAPGEGRGLTFFVNRPDQIGARREAVGMHYDIGPTVLDILGIDVDGQLGLGRSLLDQDGYLPAKVGVEVAASAYPDWRIAKHIASLWSLESMTVENGLTVDVTSGKVAFGGHTFDLMTKRRTSLLPTLFSFDAESFELSGLYQANPGDPEPDELTAKIQRSKNALHLAIGPYLSLKSLVAPLKADAMIHEISTAAESLDDEDIVIFLGNADGGTFEKPSFGSFEVSASEVAKLATRQ